MTGFAKTINCSAQYSPGGAELFPYGRKITLRELLKEISELELDHVTSNGLVFAYGASDSEEEEWIGYCYALPEGCDFKKIAEWIGFFRNLVD